MFKNLEYDYFFETIYEIPFSFYQENNIKALFVDLDNTLVEDENHNRPAHFNKWYAEVTNQGIQLFIVTNNSKRSRVEEFMEDLPIKWYHRAHKQNGKIFEQIMKDNHLSPEEVAVIGDRLMTDVAGGRKIGAVTILTKPYIKDKNIFTRFILRPIENIIISKQNGANKNE